MAITNIGSNEAATTSVTIAAHVADDVIYIIARGSATIPTNPGGTFTTIASAAGTGRAVIIGRCVAAGSGTTSGTWTNASQMHSVVYRGMDTTTPEGDLQTSGATTSSAVALPALTLQRTDGTAWVLGVAALRAGDTDLATAPGTMVLLQATSATTSNTSAVLASYDTNAGVSSFSSQSIVNISATDWRTYSIELREQQAGGGGTVRLLGLTGVGT